MNPNNSIDPTTMSLPIPAGPASPSLSPQPLPVPGKPMNAATINTALAAPGIPPPAVQLPAGPDPLRVADDMVTSLDEESWILKTKQVIARYQEDPYTLTEELYKVRAQFMQDVHGKELKQKDEGR